MSEISKKPEIDLLPPSIPVTTTTIVTRKFISYPKIVYYQKSDQARCRYYDNCQEDNLHLAVFSLINALSNFAHKWLDCFDISGFV